MHQNSPTSGKVYRSLWILPFCHSVLYFFLARVLFLFNLFSSVFCFFPYFIVCLSIFLSYFSFKYADCRSAEEKDVPPNECPGYGIALHLMVRLLPSRFRKYGVPLHCLFGSHRWLKKRRNYSIISLRIIMIGYLKLYNSSWHSR